MYKHFLQSSAWKAFQESEGKQVFEVSETDFSFLAVLEHTRIGDYLYVPYGPSLAEKAPKIALKHALTALKTLASSKNCVFVRIEPTVPFPIDFLKSLGLSPSKELNPARTWLLDLSPSKEELLSGMSQGTRTRHNQFSKKGLSVEVSKDPSDISHLIRLQHKLAREKGINTFSDSYLKNELAQPFASLYLVRYTPVSENPQKTSSTSSEASEASKASKNPSEAPETSKTSSEAPETSKSSSEGLESSEPSKIISASLFFDDLENKTRFYMQSATDSDYKKLPATVGLLTASIFDAKEKGLKFFDFWGIAPENAPPTHPWAGFTAFKKSFGGFARDYSGTFDLALNKKKYALYKSLRSLNLRLRKLKS